MARFYLASAAAGVRRLAAAYYYSPESTGYNVYNWVGGEWDDLLVMGHVILNHNENGTSGNMVWVRMLDESLRPADSLSCQIDGLIAGDFADVTVCYREIL